MSSLEEAKKRAAKIIEDQEAVPESPGIKVGGKMQYCLAAAMVAGECRLFAPARVSELDSAINSGLGREYIFEMFNELGWGEHIGRQMLELNDSIAPDARRSRVLMLLRS